MNFLKIEGNGFVICLGIILLLTGLIMFYVKQRFAVYDKLLSEQNKLLKHVVSNIENISTQHFQSVRDLSNPIALSAAANAVKNIRQVDLNENTDNSHNKYPAIVVSDDEISSNEDDDDDDEDESEDSEDESSEEESEEISDSGVISTTSNKTKVLKIDNFNFNSIKHLQSSEKSNSNSDESNSYDDTESQDEDSNSSDDNQLIVRKNDNYSEIKVVELDLPIEKKEYKQENDVSDLIIENLTTNSNSENNDTKNNYNTIDKLNISDLHDDMKQAVSKKIDLADSVEAGVLSTYKKNKLEELCRDKNLSTKGTRMELIKRLMEYKEEKEDK